MIRTSIATTLGLAVAVLVAWQLGGPLGGGVLMGFVMGAGMCVLGVLYQRHALIHRPETALTATGVSFLAKFAVLLCGALAFHSIEEAAAWVNWRSFLVAYAAAVAVILPLGVIDATLAQRRHSRDQGGSNRVDAASASVSPKQMEPTEA
ncbi:MAG: hypothetical protein ACI8QS_002671 [Planctomycetota bacterium]|jgi:hypothetical protein